MYIVLGASGQVGAAVTEHLLRQGKKVRAIVRNPEKAAKLEEAGAEIAAADATDKPALLKAFEGGTTAFLLTPENPGSANVIGETKKILAHYRSAIEETGIRKVVCLSSIGAQHASGTGNLVQSYLLENTFPHHPALQQLFVRPSYYYSNWLGQLPVIRKEKVLPSFFPGDFKLPMNSPQDIADFAAGLMVSDTHAPETYEVHGPQLYSPSDVADAFSDLLGFSVKVRHIPRNQWHTALPAEVFSEDAARNFIEMTDAVLAGKTVAQDSGTVKVKVHASLQTYLEQSIGKK